MTYEIAQTCMLVNLGLDRSECASWVQAWGSIAAIGVAIWLGRRSENKAAAGAKEQAHMFKAAVLDALSHANSAAKNSSIGDLRAASARLAVIGKIGMAVRFESLDSNRHLQTVMMLALVESARSYVDRFIEADIVDRPPFADLQVTTLSFLSQHGSLEKTLGRGS